MKLSPIFGLLLLALPLCAQTITPNLGYTLSNPGAVNWGYTTNHNFLLTDNAFASGQCGDATHAVGFNVTTHQLFCQSIPGTGVGILPIINGGTGTATPSLIPGTNITVTGAWPNQTISGTGGGGGGIIGSPVVNTQVSGTGTAFAAQAKPIYDTRDWMTCDGVTNASAGFGQLLTAIGSNDATIYVVGQCLVGSLRTPTNVTLDFSGGGSLALIVDHTAPGGGAFVQGAGTSNPSASPTTSCSVTLPSTVGAANHFIVMMVGLYGTFAPDNARITSVTDTTGNFYIQKLSTTLGFPGYEAIYIASAIAGGSATITANFSHSEKNSCIAWEGSGLGSTPNIDGNGTFATGSTTPFSPGSTSLAVGDFVVSASEDPNGNQTCTAGAGYTQPASTAGNVNGASGPSMCAEYVNAGAGGSTTSTQNFSSSPVSSSYISALAGFLPGSATVNILGGVLDPDLHQIFFNATGTNGVVDFTGNTAAFDVHPEWWGAFPNGTASANTAPMQAAIHGAFGTKRTNASGLSIYNKPLYLNGNYQINAELQFYHVSNFKVICNARLSAGITQTGTNDRILDGIADSYGAFYDCSWAGTASNTQSLIDLDYNTSQGADLATQFIDFYNNTFIGNNVTDVGVLIAKSGGGAQGSNIYFYDNAFQGFTGAGWQVGGDGIGRNVGRSYAQNALAIDMWGGDIQGSPLYGVAVYGGGYVSLHSVSMENNFTLQTGYDMYCEATQGPCMMYDQRSESRKLIAGSTIEVYHSSTINQAVFPVPGATQPITTVMRGGPIAGDGAYYQVTVDSSAFIGVGSQAAPVNASAGSATTLADTNQSITGSVTTHTFVAAETATQAVTGSTGTVVVVPSSTGTITGSVTSGTIGTAHTMTQATTSVTCTSTNAPTLVQSLTCNNFSGTADSSHIWTDGTTGGTYTPSAAPTFSATTMIISAATGSPDSTHTWTGGTSSATFIPTSAPTSVGWTVNAFAGMLAAVASGTNINCYGVITSNTASTLTLSAGWITQYPYIACPGPDSTSTFYLEPAWNHGTVVDGGITMVYMDEDVIGTCHTCAGFSFSHIENVNVPGGRIATAAGNSGNYFKSLEVSRSDWYHGNAEAQQGAVLDRDWDVRVYLPGGSSPINWAYASNPGIPITAPLHEDLGTKILEWNTGGVNTSSAANAVSIGGRSDRNAGTSTSRNILEFIGMLGRATPFGIDQNGAATQIQGGLPTGAGTPGAIEFWLGTTGSTGSTITAGTKAAFLDTGGWHWPQLAFANLGTPANGTEVFCTDCKNVTDDTTGTFDSVAASGGHGTTVLRENGAWRVH